MSANKTYARQIAPEYQESPLFRDDEFYPGGVILAGNRQYNAHTTPAYDALVGNLDNASYDLDNVGGWNGYATATQYLNDVFPPEHKTSYSTYDVAQWKRLARETQAPRAYVYCQALYLMTGKQYASATIRGCCQSEWQEVYYPDIFGPDFVHTFEAEYFNTGTEWIIHDGADAPESPDDVDGYRLYCHTYDPRAEIARETGVVPDDVVLYEFAGYTQTARYLEVPT